MRMQKVRIRNERLWEIAQAGEDIDSWLITNVGRGNYNEWFGVTNLPFRSWSFKNKKDATMFILRWS